MQKTHRLGRAIIVIISECALHTYTLYHDLKFVQIDLSTAISRLYPLQSSVDTTLPKQSVIEFYQSPLLR